MATVETPERQTVDDLENDDLFEIIDGERVELPPMSAYSQIIASRLFGRMNTHAVENQLGETVMEVLFHLTLPTDRNRRPDVAFVSYERWPKGKPQFWKGNAWDVVPDLTVEIVSPSDFADDLLEKIDEYFRAGVRLVWVVYPRRRFVYVYTSNTAIQVVSQTDTLQGGDVLPGFALPLSDLFTEELI